MEQLVTFLDAIEAWIVCAHAPFAIAINEEWKMNEMIKRVIDKTGLSEEQATVAVNTVLQFMKEKLPAPMPLRRDSLSGSSASIGSVRQ
jgi:hypothetical protein